MGLVEIMLQSTSLLSPKIRYFRNEAQIKKHVLKVISPVENKFSVVMDYLGQAVKVNPSDPFKFKIIKYMGIYLRWILQTSRFYGGIYICGGYDLVKRKYSASRNSIYNRYKHVFPRKFYRQVHLSEAIFVAFQHKNLEYLVSFLKEMFATVNFFKHRFLLYYLRAAFVNLNGKGAVPGIRGLFIKFRGKLAKAGNSRRQRFLLAYGQVTTNYSDNYVIEKFQIKTFTGAIGCTIILCCN